MDDRFVNAARTLLTSPRICQHDARVQSDRLVASPQQASVWELDFIKRTSGYLFGQFSFDPPEDLVKEVLSGYHSTLAGPPARANKSR